MAIGVTVNYTIEDIDFHDSKVQIKYLLENDEAPLIKRYLEVYGLENPHVSCSSPQSAIFALGGKLDYMFNL
jgi:hypothetical protein